MSATNHGCEFCGVELLVKACPRCFSRMFHEARHCGQCGARVITPAAADPDGRAERLKCPRCITTPLQGRLIGGVLLDECPTCRGTFVDVSALEGILNDRRQTKAQAMLSELVPPGTSGSFSVPNVQHEGPMYVKCPDCHKLMNRRGFAHGSGVIVDVCRAHGTWFDKDELTQVVEFALGGGLERAERVAEQRENQQARRKHASETSTAAREGPLLDTMWMMPRTSIVGEFIKAFAGLLRARR